jgi:hypothetical protein
VDDTHFHFGTSMPSGIQGGRSRIYPPRSTHGSLRREASITSPELSATLCSHCCRRVPGRCANVTDVTRLHRVDRVVIGRLPGRGRMHSQPKMQFLKLRSNGSQSISLAGARAETLGTEADDFATRVSIRTLHRTARLNLTRASCSSCSEGRRWRRCRTQSEVNIRRLSSRVAP